MEPVKERLKNLEEYLPGQDQAIYSFGNFLAQRLNPKLNPLGFINMYEWVLMDLNKGTSHPGVPIPSDLAGYPPQFYAVLRILMLDIAKAVCPEDFAQEVKESYEKAMTKVSEKQ